MKKLGKNRSDLLKAFALIVTLFSWFWVLGIVLDEHTPSYIRQACALYLVGTSIMFYLDNTKENS